MRAYEEAAAAKSAPEMARALLAGERHLAAHARSLAPAWAEHWQASWRRAAAYCVDWKQALLLAATLQVQLPCTCPDRICSACSAKHIWAGIRSRKHDKFLLE
jgi:hypothetical protein